MEVHQQKQQQSSQETQSPTNLMNEDKENGGATNSGGLNSQKPAYGHFSPFLILI